MPITPEQARAELARRELARRATMTQDSSVAAVENRPDMLKLLGQELNYNPMTDEKYSMPQRIGRQAMQIPTVAMKAAGALGQREESGIASMLQEVQKGKAEGHQVGPLDLAKAAGRGLTTEPTHQFGDVASAEGASPTVAATLGLAGTALMPGIAELSAGGAALSRAVRGGIGKTLAGAGRKVASFQLEHLAQRPPEAIENFLSEHGSMITKGQTPTTVTKELSNSVAKVRQTADTYRKSVSKKFGEVLKENSGTPIIVELADEVGTSPLTRSAESVLSNSAVTNVEGEVGGRGAAQLQSVIDDIKAKVLEQRGRLTVDDVRFWQNQIDPIAANSSLGSVYAAANALDNTLAKAVGNASPALRKASQSYRQMKMLLHGTDMPGAGGTVGVYDLLAGGKTTGVTKVHDFYALQPAARKSLNRLESVATPEGKFLDKLKSRATALEFTPSQPVKGASLLGQATLAQKPMIWPAALAAITASSPKLSAHVIKGIMSGGPLGRAARTPVAKAIQDIVERFGVGPGMARIPRELQYTDTENPQQ